MMNGHNIRTLRKYALLEGALISSPKSDYPHSKLNGAIRDITFSFGKYRTITAVESALRPFDFPNGHPIHVAIAGGR